jgi:hypothetical protein
LFLHPANGFGSISATFKPFSDACVLVYKPAGPHPTINKSYAVSFLSPLDNFGNVFGNGSHWPTVGLIGLYGLLFTHLSCGRSVGSGMIASMWFFGMDSFLFFDVTVVVLSALISSIVFVDASSLFFTSSSSSPSSSPEAEAAEEEEAEEQHAPPLRLIPDAKTPLLKLPLLQFDEKKKRSLFSALRFFFTTSEDDDDFDENTNRFFVPLFEEEEEEEEDKSDDALQPLACLAIIVVVAIVVFFSRVFFFKNESNEVIDKILSE